MSAVPVNPDLLFDAEEYRRSGQSLWTFSAYPTTPAVDGGLPPVDDACRLIVGIQARGIDVAVWVNAIAENMTYVACRQDDIERPGIVVKEPESATFGRNFCADRSAELFARLEHGIE